jgi:hypothetical protein
MRATAVPAAHLAVPAERSQRPLVRRPMEPAPQPTEVLVGKTPEMFIAATRRAMRTRQE